MKLKLFTKQNILSVAVSLALFSAVPAVLAWAPPTATPPNENSRPPVNVGGNYDIKSGEDLVYFQMEPEVHFSVFHEIVRMYLIQIINSHHFYLV